MCSNLDLCTKCEALDPPIYPFNNLHTSDHILLKIRQPVSTTSLFEAVDRARSLNAVLSSAPVPLNHYQRCNLPAPPPHYYTDHPRGIPYAPATMAQLPHHVKCCGCDRMITGIRWLCANCPTFPTFDLVSDYSRIRLNVLIVSGS